MAATSISTSGEALPGIAIGPRLRAELVRRVRELECRFKPAPARHARAGAVEGISESHTNQGRPSGGRRGMKLLVADILIAAGLMLASGAAVAASIGWQCLAGFIGGVAATLAAGGIISNAE
jgi:hypothetical protein